MWLPESVTYFRGKWIEKMWGGFIFMEKGMEKWFLKLFSREIACLIIFRTFLRGKFDEKMNCGFIFTGNGMKIYSSNVFSRKMSCSRVLSVYFHGKQSRKIKCFIFAGNSEEDNSASFLQNSYSAASFLPGIEKASKRDS